MTAESATSTDLGNPILALLAATLLALILATYVFGAAALLIAALVGTVIMLGVMMFLSAPNRKA